MAYDASKEGSTAKVLDARLAKADEHASPTRIDGIIAMNDYIASEVVTELDDLGYTGSAADINPQITISGIVGNITGKKDLSRSDVPDPIKSPEKTIRPIPPIPQIPRTTPPPRIKPIRPRTRNGLWLPDMVPTSRISRLS